MNEKQITQGIIAAGIMNIGGVLLFSKALTNTVLNEADPIVMSNFGLLMIMVWGIVYISVARNYKYAPYIMAAFALEKLVYVLAWGYWWTQNDISAVYAQDFLAAAFYCIYGINDFIFMAFFAYVFVKTKP